MEIIPAIDIIEGKCVRLTHGDYGRMTVYHNQPLDAAKAFEDAGLKRLHLVDLDGARTGAVKNWKVLEAIAGKTALDVDFGGGVKSGKDAAIVLDSGARWITVGSIAVKDEALFGTWLQRFGAETFLLGADVRNEKITVSGWAEQTEVWVYDFIAKYLEKGVSQIFCTDVARDGAMAGPSTALYENIMKKFPDLWFIASGGVSSVDDLHALEAAGCRGAIVGKAIYEGRITLPELKAFNR